MKVKKITFKKRFTRKVSSLAMAFMMVANLLGGYCAASEVSTKKVSAATTKQTQVPYRNVMYYGDWSIYAGQKNFTPDKIDGSLITHLNFAFLDADENGDLITTDTWADYENPNVGYSVGTDNKYAGVLGAMLLLRQKYPNMKIGISVGGWTRSGDFPKIAASDKTRKNFANNVAKFVHYYGYDFVDIDWEYPTADRDPDPEGNGVAIDKGCKGSPADTQNFTLLLQEIRNSLDSYGTKDSKHYELSVAMSASPKMMSAIEYDKVLNIVDFANMMTYDLNGAWEGFTAHQTALYTNPAYSEGDAGLSVDSCIKYLENKYGDNIDYSKIVVGVAPYTRGWKEVKKDTGRDSKNPGLYADATGENGVTYAYSDIDSLVSKYNLKKYWDDVAKANYFYSESSGMFFTCDTEESVAEKGKYVKQKHLGGLISWMASLDAANSITKTMKESLYGSSSIPNQDIIVPGNDGVTTDVTTSGDAYTITVKNTNSSVTKASGSKDITIMPWAEYFGKTLSYPSISIETQNGETLSGDWSSGGTITSENGNTVVTPPEWSSKTLEPGSSLTFTLKSGKGTASQANIKKITLRQRAVSGGEILFSTVVYENGASVETTKTQEDATTKEQTPTTKASEQQTTKNETQTTKKTEQSTTKKVSTGTYPEWSPNSVSYKSGDLVQYQRRVYECIYPHVSNSAWTPTAAFTLWKERTDLVAGDVETTKAGGSEQGTTENNYTVNSKLPEHMVTGYWHNFLNGSKALKLSDVPSYYDMICVAFANSSTTPGKVTFELDKDLSNSLGGYTKAQFIQDIKDAKAKGQHVIISVGGAEGTTYITNQEAANQFATSLISMIEEYGFEGVDIDFEGGAVSGTDYIAEALREVHDHFGDDFIITMAPETYYFQDVNPNGTAATSAYYRLAYKIRDILTICYPQFYNTGGMTGYNGFNARVGNADFLTSLSTLLLENGLRADQVALGLPSTPNAASSGYVSTDVISTAVKSLVNGTSSGSFTAPKAYPTFRGVMTWSINWDATNGYAWAKTMDTLMDSLETHEQPTTKANTTTTKENITTKKNETTTVQQVVKPTEVIGLTLNEKKDGTVKYSWGQTEEQIASGQIYKVYIDGKYVESYNLATTASYTFTTNGNHTIKITANLNGYETEGKVLNVVITGLNTPTTVTTTKATETNPGTTTDGLSSRLMIGYYHTWNNDGNPFIKLRDVDKNWDVINISFAEPVQAGSTDGKMQFNISGLSSTYTKEDFKKDVKNLQAQGKKIVLSIGGYEGYFSLTSDSAVNQFVSDIKSFVDEYGFDGIDIDLEQSSVQFESGNDKDINNPTSPKVVNMIKAIRTICDSYGDDFILSWAPETFYVQLGYSFYGGINQYCDARAGVYLPMINALRDKTSYVHVQLYNSSPVTGLDGKSYNMGTKEGIVAMCEMLLKGFHVGAYYTNSTDASTYFAPLRPDQVVIGVPSSQGAAGSGQVANSVLQSAFTELNNNYPGIRGIMAWSINWDSSQNNNSFVDENAAFLETLKNDKPTTVAPTTKETPVVPTTVAPTAVTTTVAPTTTVTEDDTIPAPIGLTYAGNETLPYYFAWQAPASDIESYNVYVDGRLVATSNIAAINLTADAFANGNGDYVVSVKSVRNGKESKATSITYAYTGGTVDKPTTVAPTTTVAATTVAPTTVAPTTTVAATTVAPTTVAPTTTVTPTTVAPTTVAPTTVVPTTVAPTTVVPTTVAPTTVAPTTAIEDDTIPAPIGLTYAGNDALPYYFAWQTPVGDIESYNVYVDGKLVATSGTPSINLTADAFASGNGDYTVSVKSVRNGKESKATSINYTYTGGTVDKPTTVAPATTVTPTTVVPTTVAPTTEAPTTVAPTTVAPTTEAPTTVAPTTVAPTTVAPTTVAPTTVAPTTEAPTTEAPTIVAPTTEAPTTMAPTTQSETSTVAIGEGSNAGKVDSEILNCKNDKDLAGSTFGKLCVKVKKSKKKAISLTWKNIQVAKTYVIYGAKCGTSYKKIATVHSKTFTNKKLKKGTYYKYMVVALNEKGEVVAISKLIHVATKGGKVGNCKKLKVNKSKVNLKQGRKFKLKVKQIAESKKVKLKKHRKIAFESDNQDVAVVSKKGVITAKKKGKCSVYVYAQNGVYKQVKVTVK
ncbi:MAG: glycosyl hydrolase family 18 protein [Eubacterium sp.]|uniref:glycosyl hydrolase family 18 protein n=1 Tax=Eubacterium sp. TaxID=142586 RepID=UPI003995A6A9